MADLEKVEPAVIDAQQAVKAIKKQHLVEVRPTGQDVRKVHLYQYTGTL